MRKLSLKKFSSQISPEVLEALKEVANREGRKLHAVLDEAFRDYLVKKGTLKPKELVMTYFEKSLQEFEPVYQGLASSPGQIDE